MSGSWNSITETTRDARRTWKSLLATGLIYKALVVMMLMPLFSVILRVGLRTSGQPVLADEDILWFLLGPVGWIALIVLGALWLSISALEQTALLGILATAKRHPLPAIGALQFATGNAWSVLQLVARMLAWTLLAVAPCLALLGIAYITLLSDYDINYYLKEKPTSFLIALLIAGVILAVLAGMLLRWLTSWFLALPLVLFGKVAPSEALRASRDRAKGHRWILLGWLLAWLALVLVISAIATGMVVTLGRWLLPGMSGSLTWLTFAAGGLLLVWSVMELAINLLGNILLACLFLGFARQLDAVSSEPAVVSESAGGLAGRWFRLTVSRVAIGSVIGLLVAAAIGMATLNQLRLEDDVIIIAHRGASARAPENTMAAVQAAIVDQADWVEIDVQEIRDGEVVVFHDSDFMRMANSSLKIWDATPEELNQLDIGSWFAAEFNDQRVPTLAELLQACKGQINVLIELKYYGHDEQLESRVIDQVEQHGMSSEVMYMSLKADSVEKLKQLRPEAQVGWLLSVSAGDLSSVNADFLAVNAKSATRSFIDASHRRNQDVYAWTVNDAVTMSNLIGRGIDGLITDEPALAHRVLEERRQLSIPERLLVSLAGTMGLPAKIDAQ
ncbi:MAG: glycerophosphodiester phosphodiesterase family protein [Planctomycetota bacterium]